MKTTRSMGHVFFKTFLIVASFLQMSQSFAIDSTKVKIPKTEPLVQCPIAPDLTKADQCKLITPTGGQEMAWSQNSLTTVNIFIDNPTCKNEGDFSVFSGFPALGFYFQTGAPPATNTAIARKQYYCCKQIVRWVPKSNCKALT